MPKVFAPTAAARPEFYAKVTIEDQLYVHPSAPDHLQLTNVSIHSAGPPALADTCDVTIGFLNCTATTVLAASDISIHCGVLFTAPAAKPFALAGGNYQYLLVHLVPVAPSGKKSGGGDYGSKLKFEASNNQQACRRAVEAWCESVRGEAPQWHESRPKRVDNVAKYLVSAFRDRLFANRPGGGGPLKKFVIPMNADSAKVKKFLKEHEHVPCALVYAAAATVAVAWAPHQRRQKAAYFDGYEWLNCKRFLNVAVLALGLHVPTVLTDMQSMLDAVPEADELQEELLNADENDDASE